MANSCSILLGDGTALLLEDGTELLLADCVPSGGGTGCEILLADGTPILLEDGTALLLANCGTVEVTTGGGGGFLIPKGLSVPLENEDIEVATALLALMRRRRWRVSG